jgi:Domain of unknown function (DUF4263)
VELFNVPKKTKRNPALKKLKYVTVKNNAYGNKLKGTKIYFEGKRPSGLRDDGMISFGKHILELLNRKYERFRWTITEETDSLTTERGIVRFKISQQTLSRLNKRWYGISRDMKNDIVGNSFAALFPSDFQKSDSAVYVPGILANILTKDVVSRLSSEDKEALTNFLPDFISSESIASVNLLKAEAQIQSLKDLAVDMEQALGENKGEAWWQTYIRSKILIIQQGYIKALDKLNVAVVETKYPDFSLLTHDSYLDILEIKKPSTPLLKKDESRGNYYWDSEISKAIIQVENYIENVSKHGPSITIHLRDRHKIDMQVLRPRGIIIAGNRNTLVDQKEKDDFRLLSHSLKNITVLTYDELLTRLRNYIEVLEGFRSAPNLQQGNDLN